MRCRDFTKIISDGSTVELVYPSTGDKFNKPDTEHHGFGLKNVRNAVSSCGGTIDLRCEMKPEGYLFLAEIVLPMQTEA